MSRNTEELEGMIFRKAVEEMPVVNKDEINSESEENLDIPEVTIVIRKSVADRRKRTAHIKNKRRRMARTGHGLGYYVYSHDGTDKHSYPRRESSDVYSKAFKRTTARKFRHMRITDEEAPKLCNKCRRLIAKAI